MNAFASLARAVSLDAVRANASPYTLNQARLYAAEPLPALFRVHAIIAPVPGGTERARRRAYNALLPVFALTQQLRSVRAEIAQARRDPPAYAPHRLLARLVLEAARTRGALMVRGRADLAGAPVSGGGMA